MSTCEEPADAREAMENAYVLWTLADPLYESERWFAYLAAVERYNAIIAEAKGKTELGQVRLPWLNRHTVA